MSISTGLDALYAVYTVTQDSIYLNEEKRLIDEVISSAQVSSAIPENVYRLKDSYLGWISKTPDRSYNNESQLFESYVFQYIVKCLYQIRQSDRLFLSPEYMQWYNNVLFFIEKHIWEKWINRSIRQSGLPYRIFLGVRTHMAAHWAGIALVLEKLSQNSKIKEQCRELYTTFDTLLKRNLQPNPVHADAYTWNSTWDNNNNTQARKDTKAIIQDVSHGNHVISYIITAQEMNSPNWTRKDISKFINAVKYVIYDWRTHTFSDLVNGTSSLTGAGRGNFQADGWLKLGRYDKELQNMYIHFAATQQKLLKKYAQSFQFYANLALNERYIQLINNAN